jgi:hypothetical protein
MVAVIAGLVLFLCGILLWTGTLSLAHALAVFIGIAGLALVLWYLVPARYAGRRRVP